eukprot:5942103-Amphidinium_carterae.1
MAEKPEDLPEEGEQDVEGAELRPEKRARGRPRKRFETLSYQHSKGCLRFRQNVNDDPESRIRSSSRIDSGASAIVERP